MTLRRAAWFILGCAATALFLGVLYALLQGAQTTSVIRETQKSNTLLTKANTENTKKISQTLKIIRSCTTPERPCSERSQRQLASTVAGLTQGSQRAAAAAAACAASLPSPAYRPVYRCVVRTLSGPAPQRP